MDNQTERHIRQQLNSYRDAYNALITELFSSDEMDIDIDAVLQASETNPRFLIDILREWKNVQGKGLMFDRVWQKGFFTGIKTIKRALGEVRDG